MRIVAGVVSPFLLLLALIASLVAVLLVSPGSTLTDSDEFAKATARAATSLEGREAITEELTLQIEATTPFPADLIESVVGPAVDEAADRPAFAAAVEAAAQDSYESVVSENPGDAVVLPLASLADPLREVVAGRNALLAEQIPEGDELGEVTLVEGPFVRWIGALGYAAGRPEVLAAALVVAVAAGAAGLLLARRRGSAAISLGIGLLLVAAVPVVIAWIARPLAEWLGGVSGQAALAGAFAVELLRVQAVAPVVAACAGGALIVTGLASRLR
jgi:hypothetical protein